MGESDKVFYGNLCFVCHKTIKEKELKKCSSCKLVFYCSEAHQKFHWKSHKSLCRVIQKIDVELKPENLENNINWYKYRTNLLMLCELKLERKLLPYEVNMILFPNNCQICHKKNNLQPCLDCLCINYCSEEHRQIDFDSHKKVCKSFALCLELDLYLEKAHYYPSYSIRIGNVNLTDTMDDLIKDTIEIESNSVCAPVNQRALISELLSCPLTLLFGLSLLNYTLGETFILHVIGCSYLETASLKSWEIILHIYPEIKNLVIYFIGPEVLESDDIDYCQFCQDKISVKFYTEFYHEFVKKVKFEKPNAICSFNCGFHEFENSNMDTWEETLPLLIQVKKVPLIFTSFTKNEADKDSNLLLKINPKLNIKINKNKFSSLRPYRDLENLEIYYNNGYIGIVSNDT